MASLCDSETPCQRSGYCNRVRRAIRQSRQPNSQDKLLGGYLGKGLSDDLWGTFSHSRVEPFTETRHYAVDTDALVSMLVPLASSTNKSVRRVGDLFGIWIPKIKVSLISERPKAQRNRAPGYEWNSSMKGRNPPVAVPNFRFHQTNEGPQIVVLVASVEIGAKHFQQVPGTCAQRK